MPRAQSLLGTRRSEVARALSIGRSKVYQLIASGELPSITIGSARRVPTEALQKWIAEHLGAGTAGT